ncbi:TPA: hypothetical protein JG946_003773 [Enterobacter hormaechei subsp. steigerwaltii]|nr:hypothetical protein [Enterobacter hormaechei subsp. steigerwaltii]
MSKIKTYHVGVNETIELDITEDSIIQSPHRMTLQFTDQTGSFLLVDNFPISPGKVFVTNPTPAPCIVIVCSIAKDTTPVVTDEVYMFNIPTISTNVTHSTPGATAYYDGGALLRIMPIGSTYPLEKHYQPDYNGRPTSINSFTQYSYAMFNDIFYQVSSTGIIGYDREAVIYGDHSIEVDSDMLGMAVKDNYSGEFISSVGDPVVVEDILPNWKRYSKQVTISMLGEVTVYWAINNEGDKFVGEVLDLPVGTYTISKYVDTSFDSCITSTPNITNTSTLQIPYTLKRTYSGSTVKVKPDSDTWNKVTVTYCDDSSTDYPYYGDEFEIPYSPKLIKSVRFFKESK